MKSMHHYNVSFLAVLMLLSGNLHSSDWQRERKRQTQITGLLTYYQNHKIKKPEDTAQKLLDEECERKMNADHAPLAPLARAGIRQHERNKAYMQTVQSAIQNFPAAVQPIICGYARPEWVLDRTFKLHNDRVYDLGIAEHETDFPAISFSTGAKTKVAFWETDTGTLRRAESSEGYYKPLPRQLSGFSKRLYTHLTDFASSPDGQKIAATAAHKNNLYIWPSELSLAAALAAKKVLNIRNKAMSPDESDRPSINPFTAVTFSPCSTYVFVGGADGIMHQFNATTGEAVYIFDHPTAVTALAVSSNGNSLYAGLQDGSVVVWQGGLLPPPAESVALPDAPEAPQPALMTDESVRVVEDLQQQKKIADWYCLEDCTNCCKHGKKSCSLCAQACKAAAACCYSGVLCAVHCPRACVCGCGYAVCVKKCCVPLLCRLSAPFRRWW